MKNSPLKGPFQQAFNTNNAHRDNRNNSAISVSFGEKNISEEIAEGFRLTQRLYFLNDYEKLIKYKQEPVGTG